MISSLCVYCGSSGGSDPRYGAAAAELGTALAGAGITLVYGGGRTGLMGTLADSVLAGGGRVVGVLPRGLFARELCHQRLTELHEVGSMHERKKLMFDLSDGFAALPGGLGTLEELAEVATWSQLGLHRKPIIAIDVGGYWTPLLDQLDRAVADGFLAAESRNRIVRVGYASDLLGALDHLGADLAAPPAGTSPSIAEV